MPRWYLLVPAIIIWFSIGCLHIIFFSRTLGWFKEKALQENYGMVWFAIIFWPVSLAVCLLLFAVDSAHNSKSKLHSFLNFLTGD